MCGVWASITDEEGERLKLQASAGSSSAAAALSSVSSLSHHTLLLCMFLLGTLLMTFSPSTRVSCTLLSSLPFPSPPLPSFPSRLAQWTARSLSSLPGMQRSCLLLRRAAMLSEWNPGVSETNWGSNPQPSTLSAGECRLRLGRDRSGGYLLAHGLDIVPFAGWKGQRWVFYAAWAAASRLLPPVVSVFRSRQLTGLC